MRMEKIKKLAVHFLCIFIPSKKRRKLLRKKFLPPRQRKNPWWLGTHSYFGEGFKRTSSETTIGKFCSIGQNVAVGPSQHPRSWLSSHPFQYLREFPPEFSSSWIHPVVRHEFEHVKPCFIGNDVWIGNNVVIMDGVSVPDGCIVGSNAVVTHTPPPYSVSVGVPAKVLKYRFPPEVISRLLRLKWWDLPEEEIAKLAFNDIETCLEQLEEIRKRTPL